MRRIVSRAAGVVLVACVAGTAHAQVPPSSDEKSGYAGLLSAAARGDAARITALTAGGEKLDTRDAHGRTPLHVAAFGGHHDAMRALVAAGANPDALENDRYDLVTIAAVANDVPTLKMALTLGASAKNVTSRYDGTALIAAAHLGHAEAVRTLVRAGAPLDHVNNLGWTALIESIVLGDGGPRHTETLRAPVSGDLSLEEGDLATDNGLSTYPVSSAWRDMSWWSVPENRGLPRPGVPNTLAELQVGFPWGISVAAWTHGQYCAMSYNGLYRAESTG